MERLKIYFAGSIRGGRNSVELYGRIVELLKGHGEVLTEHVGDIELDEEGEGRDDYEIHDRDVDLILKSDLVVAEVSNPSLGVGYEVAIAISAKKRVLCLFNSGDGGNKKLSAMIAGCSGIEKESYEDFSGLKAYVDKFVEEFLEARKKFENVSSLTILELKELVMEQARQKGFGVNPEDINVAEKLGLIHSEISEAFEAYRHKNIEGRDGFKEELGDAIQRILHLCGVMGVDVEKAILKKMAYNQLREWDWDNMNESRA